MIEPAKVAVDVGDNDLGLDANRRVIHNRYHIISGKKYWVEISHTSTLAFIVLFILQSN